MLRRMRGARPSPAIAVAIVALVAALAGTAVASDPGASTSALNKKKVKKIAAKQVKKLAPDLSVLNSEQLGGLPPEAYEEPVAYAHVQTNGTVVADESKAFTAANVTQRPASSYCLHDLPDFKTVSATPDYQAPATDQADLSVRIGLPGSGFVTGCNAVPGSQAEVVTVRNAVFTNHGFYIQLFD